MLGEIIRTTLRQVLPEGPTVDEALETLQHMLDQAERVSLRGWSRTVRKE